jgi:DNA end-binding protein Ku
MHPGVFVANVIWSGSVGFGLVSVPIKIVSATTSHDVRFHQLENGTGSRIRYRKVAEASGEEVKNDQIVKGFELEPGSYVVVSPDELRSLAPKSTRVIEIEDFVDLDEIDPVFFEAPYYLVPDPNALKPYVLLVQTMQELRKVAIGRVVIRSKERLVAIRPKDGLLCAEMMRYADEVLDAAEVAPAPDDVTISDRELTMARQLVESLTVPFDADKYRDEYREQLVALIDKKAAGEEIVTSGPVEEPTGQVLDLMAALEQSLAQRPGKTA